MKTVLFAAWVVGACVFFSGIKAREVQGHGLLFEQWLRDTFFDGYQPKSPTQKWDIPAEANPHHGSIPVNPKAVKHGTPIALGDAMRQFEIEEPFLLIVGFWEQSAPTEKRWTNAQTVRVTPDLWRKLWHPVTKKDLENLAAIIKDHSLSIAEARIRAKALKTAAPFNKSIIQVNPKIDASQRRLQCSLRFDDFFTHLAPTASPERQLRPHVFGVRIPAQMESPARQFAPP